MRLIWTNWQLLPFETVSAKFTMDLAARQVNLMDSGEGTMGSALEMDAVR